MDHTHIVKRKGHQEPYDNHKVYASCYAACLNAGLLKESAETVCSDVMRQLDQWVGEKESVRSDEIFDAVAGAMEPLSDKAAFMYKTHRDVS